MRKLPSFSQLSDVSYTVKPVLRGHLWDKEKEAGGLLIEVTTLAVLTIYRINDRIILLYI